MVFSLHRRAEDILYRLFRPNVYLWGPEVGSGIWSPQKRLGGTAKEKTTTTTTNNQTRTQKQHQMFAIIACQHTARVQSQTERTKEPSRFWIPCWVLGVCLSVCVCARVFSFYPWWWHLNNQTDTNRKYVTPHTDIRCNDTIDPIDTIDTQSFRNTIPDRNLLIKKIRDHVRIFLGKHSSVHMQASSHFHCTTDHTTLPNINLVTACV